MFNERVKGGHQQSFHCLEFILTYDSFFDFILRNFTTSINNIRQYFTIIDIITTFFPPLLPSTILAITFNWFPFYWTTIQGRIGQVTHLENCLNIYFQRKQFFLQLSKFIEICLILIRKNGSHKFHTMLLLIIGFSTVRNFYRNFPKHVAGVLFSYSFVKNRNNFTFWVTEV